MTRKEALKSMLPVDDDKLIDKIFIDMEIDGSVEYSSTDGRDIDLAAVELYIILYTRPDLRQGTKAQNWRREDIATAIFELRKKHDALPKTETLEW